MLGVEIHIILRVTYECGHSGGVYVDRIAEKYPCACGECGFRSCDDKYPWTIETKPFVGTFLAAKEYAKSIE